MRDAARILFVTSNGTGLGHLTRSMAFARRLDPALEPLFITFSAAAPVVAEMGLPVEYIASYATPGAGNDYRWSRRARTRLRAAIAEAAPDLLVFDGTHPYEALLGAFEARPEMRTVWCRRALWKQGTDTVPLRRAAAFDAVLEPGEFAAAEDRGPTVALRGGARCVDPVVLLDPGDLLPRAEAARELGLDPARPAVLVSLGQGEEVREATRRCLAHLARREDVQVAALESSLAALGEVPGGVTHLRSTYPMSRYFAAFDAVVSACGYNAYHELIALGPPALHVPMPRETDDQAARARYAAAAGVGLAADGPADARLEGSLDRLLDPEVRVSLAATLHAQRPANGAGEAASWLASFAVGEPAGAVGAEREAGGAGRAFRRRWGTFLRYAPRTAARLARQQLTQPRPRTLILAAGIDEDEVLVAVRAALADAGEAPPRALVVTDALSRLGELRGLGVGVEHIPARESPQAQLAGLPYEDFLRGRLELILAERPRPRRTLVAPGGNPVSAALPGGAPLP